MKRPYVGITDFTAFEEVEAMLDVLKEAFAGKTPRDLMVGTMMSYKTLKGLPTKWADAFPKPHEFEDIYPKKREGLLNTLHYADYDDVTSFEDLAEAVAIANVHGALDALQLDMIWPSPDLIMRAIESDIKIILQVGSMAMEQFGNDPIKVVAEIKKYGNSIHAVLFDRSGGLGKAMNPDLLHSYILEAKCVCPRIHVAVAGGLGPETMHLVAPLVMEFPDLSIDAQGKLRRSGNALDPIDWDLAEKYIRESGKIFM